MSKSCLWLVGCAIVGGTLGAHYSIESHRLAWEQERVRAMALCSAAKGLGTYWVAKQGSAWHCFYEQPSWPHRIKRSAMVFASGIEGPKPLGPRDRH